MALSQPYSPLQGEPAPQAVVLHLDPLHNWSDIVVLGLTIVLTSYLAVGELVARGWSADAGISNDLSVFAPLALGLSVMAWRRFRRVSLTVDDEQIEAVSVWGLRKTCRLDGITRVLQEGKPLARQLVLIQGDTPVFKVLRNVWTAMQLQTLSVFLGVPIPGGQEALRSRIDAWIGTLFMRGFDALFVVMVGSMLINSVSADLEARTYLAATTICSTLSAEMEGTCYALVPVKVSSIGNWAVGRYSMTLASPSHTYEITAASSKARFSKFYPGMTTYAKLWQNNLTLLEANGTTWIDTTDNPLYREVEAHTGVPTWIVALIGLIPVLIRLHPVIT